MRTDNTGGIKQPFLQLQAERIRINKLMIDVPLIRPITVFGFVIMGDPVIEC